ncbi:MAG: ribosomal-processing cysteine protease Prp [Clostridia bacterium]|nr:ribosomal-processing cysteine protease Prp [Clostridia bacterium]
MIRVEFVITDNKILAFSVSGHAGLAPAPHDILCASVSAMTQLVINTVTDVFQADAELEIDEQKPLIRARFISVPNGNDAAVQGVLRGFLVQLEAFADQYPSHVSVREKRK